ncbi:MAG: pantoate--beta-alanine ligase [Lentisphaerae bacterium]|nr:pantoate--beta-alanine ligase [Lentisphaerota bacterium]
MIVVRSIQEMQEWSDKQRMAGETVAVVPTMGFLHEGHLSLIDTARANGATKIILTNFVNPTQFGPNEDFDAYPRDLERDLELCRQKNVDAVFAPAASEMYPADSSTWVTEEKLSKGLCGKSRPIHFRGVASVVTKLFNATMPHLAVFGQKDAQQVAVLKRMVRDLNVPVRIVVSPIIREEDGLAKSSRNKYLSAEQRVQALSLSKAIFAIADAVKNGSRETEPLLEQAKRSVTEAGGRVDYFESVDAETLEPVTVVERPVLFAAAVFYGTTRLIDNVVVNP